MGAQGIVISLGKSSAGLADDCGGYDSPDSRQRAEDRNVAVLPRLVVLLTRRLKLAEQSFDAGTATLALAVDQTQLSGRSRLAGPVRRALLRLRLGLSN